MKTPHRGGVGEPNRCEIFLGKQPCRLAGSVRMQAFPRFGQVQIHRRRFQLRMGQRMLHINDVGPIVEHHRRESVPHIVHPQPWQTGFFTSAHPSVTTGMVGPTCFRIREHPLRMSIILPIP